MAIPGSVRELTVADAMIANPKTLGVDVGLADAQRAFADDHVRMLLLTLDGVLHGTLIRDDLRPCPDRSLNEAQHQLERSMARRLAVTDASGRLLGLLCLKRSRDGFCSESDVLVRAHQRTTERAHA